MFYKLIINKFILAILIGLISFLIIGCAINKQEYRAYMVDDSDWELIENCGYEGCYPLVDFITGKDIVIRVELHKINIPGYFVLISVNVFNDHQRGTFNSKGQLYEIKPSDITIEIDNKKIAYKVASKAFFYNSTLSRVRTEPELLDTYRIDKMNNLSIVFEYPITQNEDVTMKFNDALKLNGKRLDVPTVYFRKNLDEP